MRTWNFASNEVIFVLVTLNCSHVMYRTFMHLKRLDLLYQQDLILIEKLQF